ncbi:MAG TPA: hypothetical protein VKE25_14140 [Actinomycetes bacterium]|nr:hypothetical protein [Actinomycetes bacterium]
MSDGTRPAQDVSGWAVGIAVFAGTLMIVLGVFHAIQGLVALLNDDFYVQLPNYTFEYDLTSWGWIHLILGALIAVAGFAVLGGAVWARAVGIALAGLSAIANFLWLPYYPVWSVVAIGLAVATIWGLAMYRSS